MDKRKNNGGNSTKAKGVDKRKNEYKNAINEAISYDDVKAILKRAFDVGMSDAKDRMKAMQFVLEYTLGKPKESLDLNATIEKGIDFKELIQSWKSEDK